MKNFWQTEYMMSPAAAATATTLITGALVKHLAFPAPLTCVGLSILFGVAYTLDIDKTVSLFKRLVFFVIITTLIFTIAVGINDAGIAFSEDRGPRVAQRGEPTEPPSFFREWF